MQNPRHEQGSHPCDRRWKPCFHGAKVRRDEGEKESGQTICFERSYSMTLRRFTLWDEEGPNHVQAKYNNCMLGQTLTKKVGSTRKEKTIS